MYNNVIICVYMYNIIGILSILSQLSMAITYIQIQMLPKENFVYICFI